MGFWCLVTRQDILTPFPLRVEPVPTLCRTERSHLKGKWGFAFGTKTCTGHPVANDLLLNELQSTEMIFFKAEAYTVGQSVFKRRFPPPSYTLLWLYNVLIYFVEN